MKKYSSQEKVKLLNNLNTSASLIEEILFHNDIENNEYASAIEVFAAAHNNTTAEVLNILSFSEYAIVQMTVLENPNTPVNVSNRILRFLEYTKKLAIQEALELKKEKIIISRDINIFDDPRALIAYTSTDPDLLRMLSDDINFQVCGLIADNKHTPKDILVKLSAHDNSQVKSAVAENKNTPSCILNTLATSSEILDLENL